MAQVTTLQPYGVPGQTRTFVAKSAGDIVLQTTLLNIISSTIVEPKDIPCILYQRVGKIIFLDNLNCSLQERQLTIILVKGALLIS